MPIRRLHTAYNVSTNRWLLQRYACVEERLFTMFSGWIWSTANMEHKIGCTICYAVCPVDAVVPIPDGTAQPDLSWASMERVRLLSYKRGTRRLTRHRRNEP